MPEVDYSVQTQSSRAFLQNNFNIAVPDPPFPVRGGAARLKSASHNDTKPCVSLCCIKVLYCTHVKHDALPSMPSDQCNVTIDLINILASALLRLTNQFLEFFTAQWTQCKALRHYVNQP